jgi:phospholipase C
MVPPRSLFFSIVVGTGLAACGGKLEPGDTAAPPTPIAWDRPVLRPEQANAAATRAACGYGPGAMAAETLAPDTPVGADIPVDKIVVVMMENRSFDHYFGQLAAFTGRSDIDVAPADATNPDHVGAVPGALHPRRHAPHLCARDTEHSWSATHEEWNGGRMDGFFAASAGDPHLDASMIDRSMWWYDAGDLPFYYALASRFAIGDHYHASVLGPTWPNRMYLLAATSFGRTTNDLPDLADHPFPHTDASVLDLLTKRHVAWTLFADGASGAATVHGDALATRWGPGHVAPARAFLERAATGSLPAVSFVDPDFSHSTTTGQDEHPPADVQLGQRFVAGIVRALLASPDWPRSALFLTYDEHGGYYDHAPPPAACAPDARPPIDGRGAPAGWAFERLGVRVPFIVVSPYAKPGYVGHATYDHTSITRFIEAKFKLPALTARDANAEPPMDLFDFARPSFLTPPSIPEPPVDDAELAWCKASL